MQLTGCDEAGIPRAVVFQYELPLNFEFEPSLSIDFAAIKLMKGEYVGFLFASPSDKDDFVAKLT